MSYADRDTFARQLAEALIEADKQQEQNRGKNQCRNIGVTQNDDELISATYRLLCHDDPTNISSDGCHALAEALIRCDSVRGPKEMHQNNINRNENQLINKKYALSNRLVEGIVQCVDRIERKNIRLHDDSNVSHCGAGATNGHDLNPTNNIVKEEEVTTVTTELDSSFTSLLTIHDKSIQITKTESSLESAYSTLAWYVFGRIPLACFISDDWYEIQALLGSFRYAAFEEHPSTFQQSQEHDNEMIDHRIANTLQNVVNDHEEANHQHSNGENNGNYSNGTITNNDDENRNEHVNNDISEVWATESDPSDYEYESAWNIDEQIADLDGWASKVQSLYDPIELSIPPKEEQTVTSHDRVRTSMNYLARQLTTARLSALSDQEWQALRISDYMTQLILTLCLSSQVHNNNPIFRSNASRIATIKAEESLNERYCTAEYWQSLAIHVVEVFRNAVLERINDCSRISRKLAGTLLDDFLRMITTSLKVYEVTTESSIESARIKRQIEIPPATWIGLSALSSLCTDILQLYRQRCGSVSMSSSSLLIKPSASELFSRILLSISTLQATIEQSSDELSLFFEVYSEKNNKHDLSSFLWMYLSFFQVFSVSSTVTNSSVSKETQTIASTRSQILLNSGLFRQLLISWKSLYSSGEYVNISLRMAIEDCVFDLCSGSPNLLGKYAWRFPDFSVLVTEHTDTKLDADVISSSQPQNLQREQQQQQSVDTKLFLKRRFLWCILGMHLTEANKSIPTTTTVVWKSRNSLQAKEREPITVGFLGNQAWGMFHLMCQDVIVALTDWKLRRENELDNSSKWTTQKSLINECTELLVTLASKPLLRYLFCSHFASFVETYIPCSNPAPSESGGAVYSNLYKISLELKKWPNSMHVRRHDDKVTRDSNDSDATEASTIRKLRCMKEKDMCVAKLRKALKMISFSLEDKGCLSGIAELSSKAD